MVYYNQYFSRVVFIPNKSPNQPVFFFAQIEVSCFSPKKSGSSRKFEKFPNSKQQKKIELKPLD